MTRNAYSFASKAAAVLILLLCTVQVSVAQRAKAPDYYQSFLNTQFWLGLRFGLNYTDPVVQKTYTSFNSLDDIDETYEKTYNVFDMAGGQAGLQMSFYHRGFSFELNPTFKIVRYNYSSDVSYQGNSTEDDFETQFNIQQNINLIEVPFFVKYEILRSGEFRPFVLAGLQYSFLVDARKNAEIIHTDFSGGVERTYNAGNISLGARDQFQNFYGAVGGAGANFDLGNVRTILELSYLYALSPVTDQTNLYQENELASLGEVNDEINLNNINVALSFVFPFRYLDKSFQSN